jgi:hypothetical protein
MVYTRNLVSEQYVKGEAGLDRKYKKCTEVYLASAEETYLTVTANKTEEEVFLCAFATLFKPFRPSVTTPERLNGFP